MVMVPVAVVVVVIVPIGAPIAVVPVAVTIAVPVVVAGVPVEVEAPERVPKVSGTPVIKRRRDGLGLRDADGLSRADKGKGARHQHQSCCA